MIFTMISDHKVEIHVGGKQISVPAVCFDDKTIITTGKWLKMATIMDDELLEGATVSDPGLFVARLMRAGVKADIFTFAQKLPDVTPKHNLHLEWDNAAVMPITSYSDWWERRAEYDVRKAVKRSRKLGVVVKLAEFDDTFVEGIRGIYNESPVRQGTAFWHYQKDFETVKRENSTYLDRSVFIGAYYNEELIGFIRMVYVGTVATTLQVISQKTHFDKKPTNALIAKAVEICEAKRVSHLVYGSYLYNETHSSLTEFKRRNGFEMVSLPRYFVPLTPRGKMALKLGLHHPLVSRIPKPVRAQVRRLKELWHQRRFRSTSQSS